MTRTVGAAIGVLIMILFMATIATRMVPAPEAPQQVAAASRP